MNAIVSHGDGQVDSTGDQGSDNDERQTDRLLVLDAHKNASVVFARALSENDVEIIAGGWSKLSPGMLSRHVAGRFLYSSPYQQPDQFIEELRSHLRANSYLAVIPLGDLTHVMLSKNKRRLEATGTTVGTESWETFVAANNKKSLAELIDTHSVTGPYTRSPESRDDVAKMKDEFSYPVVIKPQYTTVQTEDGAFTEARISDENYVEGAEKLVERYRSLVEEYPYLATDLPIIQEVISGTVMATCGVTESGEFIEYFQEERLRMFPVDGGSSALRQGIHHPEMAEDARELVAALDWTGPIYVEFVHSPDGSCYVLEVNGRYWGSVGCAVCGGVNVPLLHYRQLGGVDNQTNQGYQLGKQQRRLFYTDIKWLMAQLESGNIEAVVPFLKSFFEADDDLLVLDDPLPVAGAMLWAGEEILLGNGPREPLNDAVSRTASDVLERLGGANE